MSRRSPLLPAPAIWADLGGGPLLLEVLADFYARVFADERLKPFFDRVTIERVIEKQYTFLRSKLTGEDVYFGDRPRNAHHWMVISDDLFDHREALLARCVSDHGLPERVADHLRAISEAFRKQIVKAAPRPRKMAGVTLPLDGYGSLELEVAYLCDGCGDAVDAGETVLYHRRTGDTFCETCAAEKSIVPVEAAES